MQVRASPLPDPRTELLVRVVHVIRVVRETTWIAASAIVADKFGAGGRPCSWLLGARSPRLRTMPRHASL